ncbi:MAG TPA: hypothetical protein VFT22_18490, partial [Kofleriaceae bacterium]|nr:hypothetical protein [Kofleriaceae bacterium]
TYPGVVGVFWGYGDTGGVRHRDGDKRLCVHVRWKRPTHQVPGGELIDRRVRGIPTDVIEVGRVRAHTLVFSDDLVGGSGKVRHGSITGIARDDAAGAIALVSGHVTLPVVNGAITRAYAGGGSVGVTANETGGDTFTGTLLRGRLGGPIDYAIARFPGASGAAVSTQHAMAGKTPFRARAVALIDGESVRHYSRLPARNKPIFGRYDQQAATAVEVTLPDGRDAQYTSLLAVRSTDTLRFSNDGDSGSLVVDDHMTVVGTVLGASADLSISYVLPISALIDELGPDADRFFR